MSAGKVEDVHIFKYSDVNIDAVDQKRSSKESVVTVLQMQQNTVL